MKGRENKKKTTTGEGLDSEEEKSVDVGETGNDSSFKFSRKRKKGKQLKNPGLFIFEWITQVGPQAAHSIFFKSSPPPWFCFFNLKLFSHSKSPSMGEKQIYEFS